MSNVKLQNYIMNSKAYREGRNLTVGECLRIINGSINRNGQRQNIDKARAEVILKEMTMQGLIKLSKDGNAYTRVQAPTQCHNAWRKRSDEEVGIEDIDVEFLNPFSYLLNHTSSR